MLTQAMPALVKALDGVLPPEALKQLTQALGNCNQPLTSRAGLNVQSPNPPTERGIIGDPPWDPRRPPDYPPDYPPLFPDSGPNDYKVDVPGWSGPGAWNMNNYAGNSFNFATPQYFNSSNYYGAPTFNVGGNSFFDTVNTTNINVSQINGQPAPGPAGATGPSGPPGAAGRDGEDGEVAGIFAAIRVLQYARNGTLIKNLARRLLPIPGGIVTSQGDPTVDLPDYSIDGTIDLPTAVDGTASFSADAIDLEDSGETLAVDGDVDVPTTIEGEVTVSGTVDVPDVAGTVSITGSVTVDVLEGETVTCEIQLPAYVFDPETCELTRSESETYTVSVQVPKFGVTSNTLDASHTLSLSAETDVTCTLAATAEHDLTLGDVQPLPVTGTVPKLRVKSATITVTHDLALDPDGATAPVNVEATATPDEAADIDMTPVTYVFGGVQPPGLWLQDILAVPADVGVAQVFTP
jgi:hypothetical protein